MHLLFMEEKKAELQQLSSRIRDNIIEAVTSDRDEKILDDLKHRLIVSLIFVVPLIGVTLLEDNTVWGKALEAALLIPIVIMGHRVFVDGFTAVRSWRPEKNTLAAIGTIAALFMLQFMTAGVFLTTMALCRWSEAYVRCKLDVHLKQLIEAEPEDLQVEPGTIITVRRGEVIPADGVITAGETVVDEELLTGDHAPKNRSEGEAVFAGSRNLAARIEMKVSRCGQDRTISRIIDHITLSAATKAPIAARAERAARIFVMIVGILAVVSALIWSLSGMHWTEGVMIAITILLIASPYTFSVGIPVCVLGATVRGAKNGILIRSADILELARDINTIAMNKTGTVTAGKPEISDILMIDNGFSLRIAGALEREAKHPIGKEIYRAATERYKEIPVAEQVEFIPGRGLQGSVEGQIYLAGNEEFMRENGISTNLTEARPLFKQGKSVVFFANENRVVGLIALRDGPRPVSLKAISRIEGMGIDVVMLTGEGGKTAEAIRSEVGIDQVFAEIRPEEKAEVIEKLRGLGEKTVAMVGDGNDDAQAIERADIGIAIGAGPGINARPADVILIDDDLMDVVRAIGLSRKTIRIIRQNLAFAYCYNVLAIAAAAAVLVPLTGPFLAPILAAFCMCASQVLVVVSTMRIRSTRL